MDGQSDFRALGLTPSSKLPETLLLVAALLLPSLSCSSLQGKTVALCHVSPSLCSYHVKIKARVPLLLALAAPFPALLFGSIVQMDKSQGFLGSRVDKAKEEREARS